jgi:hypothetical protein
MIDSGIDAVELEHGDHVCAFFRGGRERDALLLPFLRAGLEHGDKCLAVVDDDATTEVSRLAGGTDQADQLTVFGFDDAYLQDGHFDTDRMLDFWERHAAAAMGEGRYGACRAVGEMTWSQRDAPGVDQLVSYEARLNDFLPRYPQVILCLYDIDRFDGGTIVGMLRTHPKVLIGGEVVVNPYYVSPLAFLDAA